MDYLGEISSASSSEASVTLLAVLEKRERAVGVLPFLQSTSISRAVSLLSGL